MRLTALLASLNIYKVYGDINIEINNICVDSRITKRGDLFVCLPGHLVDGHDYATKAVEDGASALLCERVLAIDVPQIIVPNSRRALAIIAAKFYNYPSERLRLIGVTGTNGKTTTTHLIDQILNDHEKVTGLIGTIQMVIAGEAELLENTTPDILKMNDSLARMFDAGVEYVSMEVSSHALELGRVRGIDFDVAVFTNFTQDHLDFHGTMEKYMEAKTLLFAQLGNSYFSKHKFAVINADDPISEHLLKSTAAETVTYGIDQAADIRAKEIKVTANGTSFQIDSYAGSQEVNLKMIGKFNVYNALAAIAVGLVEQIPLAAIISSIEQIVNVRGRFELVEGDWGFSVIVDYAHSPDGLENVLRAAREITEGRLYCVFGAGGDRDKTKRPLMGKEALAGSDIAVVTSDNPRTEDPEKIILEIVEGIKEITKDKSRYIAITDRRAAIEFAINEANPGDSIVIAGKGHEDYQILANQVIDFDDREVALSALRRRFK